MSFLYTIEQNTVAISFDQATYTCAEGTLCTITGSLENLGGDVQVDLSVGINADTVMDPLTSEPLLAHAVITRAPLRAGIE